MPPLVISICPPLRSKPPVVHYKQEGEIEQRTSLTLCRKLRETDYSGVRAATREEQDTLAVCLVCQQKADAS